MNEKQIKSKSNLSGVDFRKIFLKHFSFWPYYMVFIFICIFISFLYLKYTNYVYSTNATIEILDKSQDSEMALPTAMTIFNRSMINLDNEIGKLSSYDLHEQNVSALKSNISFHSIGRVKSNRLHASEFFTDYIFNLKINPDTIVDPFFFNIEIKNGEMLIKKYDDEGDFIYETAFSELSTNSKKNSLPFELIINEIDPFELEEDLILRQIKFDNFRFTVEKYLDIIDFAQSFSRQNSYQSGSDQITISINYPNPLIAEEYITSLINLFDSDGIKDRQLEYKRTVDFVDERSVILEKEVDLIEIKKQEFKKLNKLTNIELDASKSIEQLSGYDYELFQSISQKDLLGFLKDELKENSRKMLPVNYGLSDQSINNLIYEYNILVNDRNRFLSSGAGLNNISVRNITAQIDDMYANILISIDNYESSLDLTIDNIKGKEKEFENFYKEIPKNEKILRSIERELEIKEALYLLLLQKKEEASINLAVVKPSIKLIETSRSSLLPVYPNKKVIIFSAIVLGFLLPALILSLWFYFDDKIHVKDDLTSLNIPVISEIPYDRNFNNNKRLLNDIKSSLRNPFIESIRMLNANLNLTLNFKQNESHTLLFTSSIKGEGKTIVSTSYAKVLSFTNKKVILLGADLRNPQIHKYLNIDKSTKGISDYIYTDKYNIEDLIIKDGDLDIILSGTIPPNPSELLKSQKFSDLLNKFKKEYDYIIIDSAPCLLVADTFEFSDLADSVIVVVRANHSSKYIKDFISDLKDKSIFDNFFLVLNGVGNSSAYGYKYGYQYGYQYGYNYGYGYGYSED